MATKAHKTLARLQEALTTCRVREAPHCEKGRESFFGGGGEGGGVLGWESECGTNNCWRLISLIASPPPIDRRDAFRAIVASLSSGAEESPREGESFSVQQQQQQQSVSESSSCSH